MYKLLSILLFAYGLALTTEDIYDNSWAVIIGIDKYQNVPNLDYAGRDAEDVKSLLIDKDYPWIHPQIGDDVYEKTYPKSSTHK